MKPNRVGVLRWLFLLCFVIVVYIFTLHRLSLAVETVRVVSATPMNVVKLLWWKKGVVEEENVEQVIPTPTSSLDVLWNQPLNVSRAKTLGFARIYVLGMKSAAHKVHENFIKRWQCAEEDFSKLGLHFVMVDGLYGASLNRTKLYLEGMIAGELGKKGSMGTIAASLNHYNTWKDIVKKRLDSAWIIEDDMRLKENFVQNYHVWVTELAKLPDWDIIYLTGGGWTPVAEGIPQLNLNSSLIKHAGYFWGSTAYGISFKGAAKLLRYAKPFVKPIDVHVAMLWNVMNHFSFVPQDCCIYPHPIYAHNEYGAITVKVNDPPDQRSLANKQM